MGVVRGSLNHRGQTRIHQDHSGPSNTGEAVASCRGTRLPRTTHTQTEHTYLTHAEYEHLHSEVPDHFRAFVLSGMRFGAATALHVPDLDLDHRSDRNVRAWKSTDGNGRRLGPTKTGRSDWTIAIPEQSCEPLDRPIWRRPADDFVFVRHRGLPHRQGAFWLGVWRPAVARFAGDTYEHTLHAVKIL